MNKKIKFLSQEEIKKCIDMPSAIEGMKLAFSELSKGSVIAPLRINMKLGNPNSGALFMPIYFPPKKLVGLKSVMINKKNPSKKLPMIQAMYNVFNSETGEAIAIMDGEYLTAIRTGAASGLATNLLSAEETNIAVIFGAGVQAENQLEGICAVRKFERIYIFDPNESKVINFIEKCKTKVSAKLFYLKNESLLKEADVICTATSSSVPVFAHENLKEKVHINGIGSYKPEMCEIPSQTVIAAKLYVDSKEACLSEAGDIINPINNKQIDESHIYAEIGEVINNEKDNRKINDKITIFKSVGNAVQDIVAASIILDNAAKQKIGQSLNL
ncbi:MAG: hypothetical protein HYS24_11930 [Ignavibacteriales bacterium]|jgi:ornithine cyclodeaminase/alanine dehydrogenase-like protein (mu-crystallin family)|nr:hypothetical protein [Ignavibacteriales bacterium]MBK7980727.1 hypothetical protein [Ignavibacteriota bacterium]